MLSMTRNTRISRKMGPKRGRYYVWWTKARGSKGGLGLDGAHHNRPSYDLVPKLTHIPILTA